MSLTRDELKTLELLLHEQQVRLARNKIWNFGRLMYPKFKFEGYHEMLATILQAFIEGDITKLMVSMPPQHSKTTWGTVLLTAILIGINPELSIAIVSYSATQAMKMGRDVKRMMRTKEYQEVFQTSLVEKKLKDYVDQAGLMEIPGHSGNLRFVGIGGGLSGNPVDLLLMDDLFKNYEEGSSPTIREKVWDWYVTVGKARMDDNAKEIMTFTRWSSEDPQGKLQNVLKIKNVETWQDIKNTKKGDWVKLNLEALKNSPATELDPRERKEALWPKKHGEEKLNGIKKLKPLLFNLVYQGDTESKAGRLYINDFETYEALPEHIGPAKNMTDPAGVGEDYCSSVNYVECQETHKLYLTDVLFSDKHPAEVEKWVAAMVTRGNVSYADIEANGGGEGFGRAIDNNTLSQCMVNQFTQSANKERRIISNAGAVNARIVLPSDWQTRWPVFADQIIKFKIDFKSNDHDDAADVLTLIVEMNPDEEIYFG